MSEQTPAPEPTPPVTPTVTVDVEAITRQAAADAAVHLKAELEKHQGTTKDEIAKAISEQNRRLMEAMNPGQKKDDVNPIHKMFIENPDGFIAETIRISMEKAEEARKREEFKGQSVRSAYRKVLKDRPDVTETEESNELLLTFYDATDESLSQEERFSAALKKVDILLEKQGAGKAEERIKRAASMFGKGGGSTKEPEPTAKTDQDLMAKELQDRKDRRKKAQRAVFTSA